jgi:multiple sugar transport system substrate-binding protein
MKLKHMFVGMLVTSLVLVPSLFANGANEAKTAATGSGEKTEIVYWQYYYETKAKLMDELIKEFEAANPDITITQQTFPYENYNTKVAASVPTGKGPNIINLYYGWLPSYIDGGYLQPLPEDAFPTSTIEDEFLPLVDAAKFDGKYYALPTAVRSLALFYNTDLFKEAGLDPDNPPQTLEELVADAKKTTKFDKNGNYTQVGMSLQLNGQIHHWIREVLVRQFGGAPYSDDGKTVTYNSQAGYDAFKFVTDLQLKEKVGMPNFMTDDVTAFKAGTMAMNIDGSFRLGTLNAVKELNYKVAEIPSYNGVKSNFASFWANGITKFTSGKQLEASIRFLKFLTSDEVMARWMEAIGELPAKKKLIEDPAFANDPQYGPFIRGLAYAHATKFFDEAGQRQVWIDAWNEITLNGKTPKEAVDQAAKTEQAILDKYYKK